MIHRRRFIGSIPVAAVALSTLRPHAGVQAAPAELKNASPDALLRSPPVVQNPRADGFGVSIAVGGLATAWVEYGFAADQLTHTAVASHHGLISADDRVLHVRVHHPDSLPSDRPIFYRVVVQPLSYTNAYVLHRGEPQATDTYALRLPRATADRVRIVSINDTHENLETILALHAEIERLAPDLLIWNGDSCNDFDDADSPEQILLNPAKDLTKSWAATRPLVFSNGNHDVRGSRAREVIRSLVGCPECMDLPYNQSLRCGPVALLTLDTGEDKPDHHPVFAGTAAYQPYRQRQAGWLRDTLARPEVQEAAFKVAACHIPLRGLPGHNDGTTLDGYASYSGFGAKLWLPLLQQADCQAILSGHLHRHRLDPPSPEMPIRQFVGGGPAPASATLTIVDAERTAGKPHMDIRIVDLQGKPLHQHRWS